MQCPSCPTPKIGSERSMSQAHPVGSCLLRRQCRGTEDNDLGKNYPLDMVLVKQNVLHSSEWKL